MKIIGIMAALIVAFCAIVHAAPGKKRIFVVSSYHKEYLWSQSTHKGLTQAMLDYGYLDNEQQIDIFTRDDFVESSHAVIKKASSAFLLHRGAQPHHLSSATR